MWISHCLWPTSKHHGSRTSKSHDCRSHLGTAALAVGGLLCLKAGCGSVDEVHSNVLPTCVHVCTYIHSNYINIPHTHSKTPTCFHQAMRTFYETNPPLTALCASALQGSDPGFLAPRVQQQLVTEPQATHSNAWHQWWGCVRCETWLGNHDGE